jgi:caffeoyl-CoA O-methyltransferase
VLHRKDIVFAKAPILQPGIAEYATGHSAQPTSISRDVWRETRKRCPQWADIATSPLQVSLLCMLASSLRARRILEVGTFTGHATVALAERLPDAGEIVTLDNFAADREARAIATAAFARSPHGHKISLIEGDASKTMDTLHGPFDLIFVDADKPNYQHYFTRILERDLLPPGGLLVFDNTLWGGLVLKPGTQGSAFENAEDGGEWLTGMLSDWARHVVAFNQHVAKDDRVEAVMLTVHDGMTLVRRVN